MRTCEGIDCEADLSGSDPRKKWCSDRCRKRTLYYGACETCGAPTAYRTGETSKFCRECAADGYRRWTREALIDAMHRWVAQYGRTPGAIDWNPQMAAWRQNAFAEQIAERFAAGDWPTTTTVQRVFGSWAAGVEAAGLESNPDGPPGHWQVAA